VKGVDENRRYVVCVKPEEVGSDTQANVRRFGILRETVAAWRKALVGNKGYRRYDKVEGGRNLRSDEEKLQQERVYDGTWVIRTQSRVARPRRWRGNTRSCGGGSNGPACKSLLDTGRLYQRAARFGVMSSVVLALLLGRIASTSTGTGQALEWPPWISGSGTGCQYVE